MSSSRPSSIKTSKSPPIQQPSRSPRSSPLPHFDDPPAPQHHHPPENHQLYDANEAEADDNEDDIPYPEPSSEQTLLPPPNFNPFFTLIEDTTSNEHYHPYVHYVFADDDPVIVTAATIRSLGLDDTQFLPQNVPDRDEDRRGHHFHHDDEDDGAHDLDSEDNAVESPLPPPIPGAKERYIIVDVGADGHTIEDAQSLSPEWQITNTNIRSAPSFNDEESPDHAYMLRIEGVETPAKSKGKAKGEPGESRLKQAMDNSEKDVFKAMDGLIKGVEERLEVAGKMLGREQVRESDVTVVDARGVGGEEGKGKAEDAEG